MKKTKFIFSGSTYTHMEENIMTKFQKQMMTIAAIGALSAVTALPAMAADVNFYGSARLATFYNMVTNDVDNDTTGFDEHLQGNARVGANFKNGDFGGKFEYGASGGNANIRLLYGTWNFGSGKLTVGQDYNRYWQGSEQVHADDNGNIGYGALWDGRQAQIRVDMNNGFYFAAIRPNGNVDNGNQEVAGATAAADNTGNESYLPKLNVGYAGKYSNFSYNVGVVGQYFKKTTNEAWKLDGTLIPGGVVFDGENVTAFMGYLTGKAAFGATSLMFTAAYGQNLGDMGFSGHAGQFADEKTKSFEGQLQLSQKLSDTMSVNVGVGYSRDKMDDETDDKMLVFANMPIKMAKYVTLVPEVSYYDQQGERLDITAKNYISDSDAKNWAVGAKWQIDF